MIGNIGRAAAVAALLTLALAGCADGGGAAPPTDAPPAASDVQPSPQPPEDSGRYTLPESGAQLKVADSEYGEIVVDGAGKTVYMFDNDMQGAGASTCEGQCMLDWPAVTTDGDLVADGITGELGTIAGVDGRMQVTLNGWPLYYFAGDAAAGDVTGQGVNGVWWVLSPAGERMAE